MTPKISAPPREYDRLILLITLFLTAVGVVMVYSASAEMAGTLKSYKFNEFHFVIRQSIAAVLGLFFMALFMRFDYKKFRPFAGMGLIACVILLAVVCFTGLGVKMNGARRWLNIGITVQPVELAKIALIIFMAHSLTKRQKKLTEFMSGVFPYMIFLGIILTLLMLQPDFGSVITLVAVAIAMLFVAGMRKAFLGYAIPVLVPACALLIMSSEYRMHRLEAFFDPWKDATGSGLQIIQSWIAIGSGGFSGKGLGQGRQKLFYLPEAHTDFILSVIGEEGGFLGLALIVLCFYFLLRRGIKTALTAPDDFGSYLAFGITFLLGFEAVFNMCVILGLVPTKGLALPFISYGGTSLVCSLAAIGILLNVSSQALRRAVPA